MFGKAWRRWSWLEWGLVPLAGAMVYGAWLLPLFRAILNLSLVQPQGMYFPAWLIVAILLLASTLKRVLREYAVGRVLTVAVGLVIILSVLRGLFPEQATGGHNPLDWLRWAAWDLTNLDTAIPASLAIVLMTAGLWAKGLHVDWTDHNELWRAFVSGVLVLGALILLPTGAYPAERSFLSNAMLVFVLVGLFALALLAAVNALSAQRVFSRRSAGLSRYWLLAVCLAVLVVMGTGWLLGWLLAPDLVAEVVRRFDPVRRLVGQIISYVFIGIVLALFWLAMAVYSLIQQWLAGRALEFPETMQRSQRMLEEAEAETGAPLSLPPNVLVLLFLAGLLAGVVLVFLLAWRKRRKRRLNGDVLEERQSIGSLDLLLDQLRGLLGHLPQRRSPFLDLRDTEGRRRAVRLLYRRVLASAKVRGYPRLPGQTPVTYGQAIERLIPGQGLAVRRVTDAYVVARYGPEPPTEEMVQDAGTAVDDIERALSDLDDSR